MTMGGDFGASADAKLDDHQLVAAAQHAAKHAWDSFYFGPIRG